MGIVRIVVLLFVYFTSEINSNNTVNFFGLCRKRSSLLKYDREIDHTEYLRASMEAHEWTDLTTSCPVIFKISGDYNYLYIKFRSFKLSECGITVALSRYSSFNARESWYYCNNSTPIDLADKSVDYLKVTVKRKDYACQQGLSAEFDIFTDAYRVEDGYDILIKTSTDGSFMSNKVENISNILSETPTDGDYYSSNKKTVSIACIAGAIVLVMVILSTIAYAMCKRRMASRGVVISTGSKHDTSAVLPICHYQIVPGDSVVKPLEQSGLNPGDWVMRPLEISNSKPIKPREHVTVL